MLASVTSTASAIAATSTLATATGTVNDLTLFLTAMLALVSAAASLYSKLREIRRGE
jgi:hypothetical protein